MEDKIKKEDKVFESFEQNAFGEDNSAWLFVLFALMFGSFGEPNKYQIADIEKRLSKLEGKMDIVDKVIK